MWLERGNHTPLTVLLSFSMSIPSWLRNLLPMLMKVNFPILSDSLPTNIFLISGFLLSDTRTAREACNASLFFSMNWAWIGEINHFLDFITMLIPELIIHWGWSIQNILENFCLKFIIGWNQIWTSIRYGGRTEDDPRDLAANFSESYQILVKISVTPGRGNDCRHGFAKISQKILRKILWCIAFVSSKIVWKIPWKVAWESPETENVSWKILPKTYKKSYTQSLCE